jgi:hypothetical protein
MVLCEYMGLKRRGLAKAADLEDLAEDGDEDAKALVLEEKKNKGMPKMPPKIGILMVRKVIADVQAKKERMGVMGRPTTYRPEYADLVFDMLTSDVYLPLNAVAAILNVPQGTFYGWSDKNEEFASAIKQGLAIQEANMSNLMMFDRVNAAGAIMTMKNSAHRWRDKIEHDIGENMAELVRKVEEGRRTVGWQDLGGYGKTQGTLPDARHDIVDAQVVESEAKEKGETDDA